MTFMTNHYLLGLYALAGVSEVLSAIIASERCFCILQPLRSQTVLRTSTMSAIIVAVFVVVVGLYFFVLARFNIVCAYEPASDRVMMMMIGSELYFRNQKFMDFLFVYVYGAGLDTVVMVVVIATTATTAAKLRKVAAWRASTSISGDLSAREIALTRMLVFNSVFFIVCVFPVAFFRLVCFVFETRTNKQKICPTLFLSRSHQSHISAWILRQSPVIFSNGTSQITFCPTEKKRSKLNSTHRPRPPLPLLFKL